MFINKILSKYIHVESCFKIFIARNPMVQLKFNLDISLSRYYFFSWIKVICMRHLKGDEGEVAVGQHAASAARYLWLVRKVLTRWTGDLPDRCFGPTMGR
jgi:hypothetical protein